MRRSDVIARDCRELLVSIPTWKLQLDPCWKTRGHSCHALSIFLRSSCSVIDSNHGWQQYPSDCSGQAHKRVAEEADATASSSSRNSKTTKSQADATAGQDAPAEPSSSNQNDGGEERIEVSQSRSCAFRVQVLMQSSISWNCVHVSTKPSASPTNTSGINTAKRSRMARCPRKMSRRLLMTQKCGKEGCMCK